MWHNGRLAILLVACLPSFVGAQMHRCETPDGRKVFSDTPCARGDIDLDKAAEVVIEIPPPVVTLTIEYYDVRGNTIAKVQQDVRAKALHGGWDDRRAAGTHKPSITVHPETVVTRRGCALRRVLMTLNSTIITPRWVETPDTPAAVRAEIEKWVRTVEGHEREHHAVAVQAIFDLRERLATVPPGRLCIDVTNEVMRRYNQFTAHLQNRQADFHRREWKAEGRL